MTPIMAMRMAIRAMDRTMTRAVETSVMMVFLTWVRLTTWTSGSSYIFASNLAMSASFFTLIPMPVSSSLIPKIFWTAPIGRKMRAVVLGPRPLQDADDLDLDVLLRDEVHVADLALFELGRLVAEDGLGRRRVREPAAALELEEALHPGEGLRVDPLVDREVRRSRPCSGRRRPA